MNIAGPRVIIEKITQAIDAATVLEKSEFKSRVSW